MLEVLAGQDLLHSHPRFSRIAEVCKSLLIRQSQGLVARAVVAGDPPDQLFCVFSDLDKLFCYLLMTNGILWIQQAFLLELLHN